MSTKKTVRVLILGKYQCFGENDSQSKKYTAIALENGTVCYRIKMSDVID